MLRARGEAQLPSAACTVLRLLHLAQTHSTLSFIMVPRMARFQLVGGYERASAEYLQYCGDLVKSHLMNVKSATVTRLPTRYSLPSRARSSTPHTRLISLM